MHYCIVIFVILDKTYSIFVIMQPIVDYQQDINYESIKTILRDTEITLNNLKKNNLDIIDILYPKFGSILI